jgi:RNA polymerase sigma-70 factor (ECF subfamily)
LAELTQDELSELVVAAQGGSQEAFAKLVQQFYGTVYAVTLAQLRSPEIAEELTQEVFVRVHLHLHQLREPKALIGWLRRIARNEAYRWFSRRQTRSELHSYISLDEIGEAVMDPDSASPREQAADREELAALRKALDKLPAPQREILLLHYIDGESKSEVARKLGIHHATVGRQIDRITSALREQLAPFAAAGAKPASTARGLSRTLAACAAVAALNAQERSALASQFATSVEVGGAAKLGGAMGGLFAGTTAKLLVPAAIALAGTATVATHYLRDTGAGSHHDKQFESILRTAPPADYVVQVRPSKLAAADVQQDDLVQASRQIVNTYTSLDQDGAGKDGFKAAFYGLPVSTTFAILRGVPAWSVDQAPASAARVDTVVRTPAFPGLEKLLSSAGSDPEKLYGGFFSDVSSKVCDRFLSQAGWRAVSRPTKVPQVRICAAGTPDATLDYATTSTAATRALYTWDQPVDLDAIAWTFLVTNRQPLLLEIDPAVKHKKPARWPGKLELPDGSDARALGQVLSYIFDLPYEVTTRETQQWLVYDSNVGSDRIQAWQGANRTVANR